jgi:hypothetical protein
MRKVCKPKFVPKLSKYNLQKGLNFSVLYLSAKYYAKSFDLPHYK